MERTSIIQKVNLKLDEITPYDSGEIINTSFIDEILDNAVKTLKLKLPLHLCNPISMGISNGNALSGGAGYVELPDDFLRLASFKMEEWERAVSIPIREEDPLYGLQQNSILKGGTKKPVVCIRTDVVDPVSLNYQGTISVNTDFPLIAGVSEGDWYTVLASVTDNAGATYTNTGLSFVEGENIFWNGDTWQNITSSKTTKRILEYFSVSSSHAISRAFYIKNDVAENMDDELIDVLAYQCAADALMIMEEPDLAKLALVKVDEFITLNSY